jgi:2-polyprenyl-3-methyl-5-hydroxy-6-metoxy-1,4-benzoquinol methylase|tara:strand:+ start:1142 stop:1906 length:765 start_codon:yes stop_codon:yes gene_type:complete
MNNEVLNYFETEAKDGSWDFLYNPRNPKSYPFIIRLQKTLNLLNDISNKKICDLGCGTGALIPFILKKRGNYTGVDFSEKMLDFIKARYPKEISENKIELILSDIDNFDELKSFDIFIGLGFIEYFEDPEKIIRKLYKILPSGGHLILSFPNSRSLDFLIVRLLTIFRIILKKIFKPNHKNPPRKMWSKKNAQKILKTVGFTDFQIKNYYVNLLVYPVTVILPSFSSFVAKKLEFTWLSKIDFFVNGFIISAKK